jgi:transposase
MTLDYVRQLYDKPPGDFESTAGMGRLANQAQKRARDMLRAGRAAEKATGKPFSCPSSAPFVCDAVIQESKHTTFDYWVKTPLGPWLPAQTHRALKNALRKGGKLRKACEVRQGKNGGLVARCFVEFEKPEAKDTGDYLACDVGVNVAVARSDGYVSQPLHPILQRTKEKRAERQRQGHRRSSTRSALKQALDREARRAVASAAGGSKTLVLESPKALGNLKPSGRIGGWARRHFGERVRQIAEISGVAVREEWPAYTSITCLYCNYSDKANRRDVDFCCQRCGARGHADILGARNLVRKATGRFQRVEAEKAGIQTRSERRGKPS